MSMQKIAEALRTNENDPQKKTEGVFEGPKGEKTDHPESSHIDSSAWEEFMKDGPELLSHAFDGYVASRAGSKSFMDQYFSSKDYESRSPLLRKYAEAGHVPSGETLSERVQGMFGRR